MARLNVRQVGLHWDRLLFSAKESVYKAWFPLMGEWLDFGDADVEIHAARRPAPHGRFHAGLLVPAPLIGARRIGHFEGRWTIRHGLVVTAVAIPRP